MVVGRPAVYMKDLVGPDEAFGTLMMSTYPMKAGREEEDEEPNSRR